MDWRIQNLILVLSNADVQAQAPPPPQRLVLPGEITENALKTAVLHAIRGIPPDLPILIEGNTFGFEASMQHLGGIGVAASQQCSHEWWAYQEASSVALGYGSMCPIGQMWIPRPRNATMTRFLRGDVGPTPLFN
eukprot:gene25741-31088_t